MSKAAQKTDVERTRIMVDLVHQKYSHGWRDLAPAYVVLEEVAPGTGWARGWADLLVLSCWKSNGMTLSGFEVKASRADLRRELADPTKHLASARYCDTWSLLVWDESVLVPGVPETWGIYTTIENQHGDREIKQLRKPATRKPESWPRGFICSLVRNAHEQGVGAHYVARSNAAATKSAIKDGRLIEESEWDHRIEAIGVALWGEDRWKWPTTDSEEIIKLAASHIDQRPFIIQVAEPK